MYSKPKGMYLKRGDRRRPSPRTDSDLDPQQGDETDGRQSPEVQVENYGDGNITADISPQWPQDFENDFPTTEQHSDTNRSETISSNEAFPERANKYVVKNDSYKDLTGDKFITVPNTSVAKGAGMENFSFRKTASPEKPKQLALTPTNFFKQSGGSSFKGKSIPRAFVKPVPRVIGTFRGNPFDSSNHSHIATVRLRPRKHHMATVKSIPKDGTIRTVKGFNLGPNATLRESTRHKHSISSYDSGGTMAFRRSTAMADRKEYIFSQFNIELDKPDMEPYAPGDMLSGRIVLETKSNVEVRFVELLIVGLATVHMSKTDPHSKQNAQEVLVSKRSYVMGKPEGRWNSVITTGKYVSKFKFKLPENLISTIKFDDKEHGFSFQVEYMVKVRICDELGSSSARSTHSMNNFVKVLVTRRQPFVVKRSFDIHSIPQAMQPIEHAEFVNLSCLPIFMDSAAVTLSLDRSVFLAGDEIHVKVTTPRDTAAKIKSLTCDLQLQLASQLKPRQMYNIVQIQEHEPQGRLYEQGSKPFVMFEFIIPTHSHFIPSFLQGCKILGVAYAIVLTVKFKSCAGNLYLECPIKIGPSTNPMSLNRSNSLPFFNRPKRFPHFSNDSKTLLPPTMQNGVSHPTAGMQRVNSTYKSKGTHLLCCCVDEGDLG